MSAPQYEPCEHRRGSGVMGTNVEYFDTPCPLCEAAEAYSRKASIVALVLLVLVVMAVVVKCWSPA